MVKYCKTAQMTQLFSLDCSLPSISEYVVHLTTIIT